MKKVFSFFIFVFLAFVYLTFLYNNVYAIEISVEAPQEQLTRGQVFDFKININTQGESIQRQEMYATYESQYVEFQRLEKGDFFDDVQYSPVETGKIYIVATSNSPKSGSGLVAVMKLKIIATGPGGAQLCAVLPITPTPTVLPTNTPAVTNTPRSTTRPTALPTSGAVGSLLNYAFFGVVFVVLAAVARMI